MFNSLRNGEHPQSATGAMEAPFSLIGGDFVVTGNLSGNNDLHIDGRVDGDVNCATLVQGPDSVIKGIVTAKVARIAGTVEGSVNADELHIESGGRIIGDCSYGDLTIASGGMIKGNFDPKTPAVLELKVVSTAGV